MALNNTDTHTVVNALLITAALVVIIAGMKVASPILVPILLSLFVATISAPPLLWLKRRGLPTFIALLIVIGVITGTGSLLAALVSASLTDFQSQLPLYEMKLQEVYAQLLQLSDNFGFDLNFSEIAAFLEPKSIAGAVGKAANELGGIVANALLIFLLVVFILLEVSTLQGKAEAIFSRTPRTMAKLEDLKRNVQRYLAIKTATSMVTGLLVWAMLEAIGIDFAILFALLAFMLNYVPNIGSFIAAIPAVLLALLQLGPGAAASVAIGYAIINLILGSIIEPRVAGRHLGLSPLVVFLSLLFWGWVLGPVGMFLSVPLTMMARLFAEAGENTRWVGVVMSDRAGDD